jgi:hypothetical protein
MPIDLEAQLAELGATWANTVEHVRIGEILERSDPSREVTAEVGHGGSAAAAHTDDRRPRWLLPFAAALIVLLVGSISAIRSIDDDSRRPVVEPVQSTDTSKTTSSPTTTVVDPTTSEPAFAPTGNLLTDCTQCPAFLLDDGRVLVITGGVGGEPGPLIQIYDPAAETFSIASDFGLTVDAERFRPDHGALLADGRVMLVGYEQLEIFDPSMGTLKTLRAQNEPYQVAAPMTSTVQIPVALDDGRVLVFSQTGASEVDPVTGALSPRGMMATPLTDAMVVVPLDDGTVLVAGPALAGDGSAAATYDPDTDVFAPVDAPLTNVGTQSAVRLRDGRVLITGDSRDAQIYDPQTRTFSRTGSMSGGSWGQAEPAALLPDGRVLVVKMSMDPTAAATTDIFDPATDTFTAGPPTTRPRLWPTAVPLRDGRVLLLGSYRGNAEGIPGDGPSSAEIFSP